jgi:hypothetical protein
MSQNSVTVEKSKSGEWWRMEYKGSVDYLPADAASPDGPTEGERRIFRESVDAHRRRESVDLNVQRVG